MKMLWRFAAVTERVEVIYLLFLVFIYPKKDNIKLLEGDN